MARAFPWDQRWLNGPEYEYMIKHHEEYQRSFGFGIYYDHPNCIYNAPLHGLVYYLKNQSLKELGFPRVRGLKKKFKWKKMNFITTLPKKTPVVQYLVATGRLNQVCYRMHIVSLGSGHPLICQMLRIQHSLRPGVGVPSRLHTRENNKPEESSLSEDTQSSIDPYTELDFELPYEPHRNLHPLHRLALIERFAPYRNFR